MRRTGTLQNDDSGTMPAVGKKMSEEGVGNAIRFGVGGDFHTAGRVTVAWYQSPITWDGR